MIIHPISSLNHPAQPTLPAIELTLQQRMQNALNGVNLLRDTSYSPEDLSKRYFLTKIITNYNIPIVDLNALIIALDCFDEEETIKELVTLALNAINHQANGESFPIQPPSPRIQFRTLSSPPP